MAISFLLDTCVLSESYKKDPHPNLVNFFQNADDLLLPAGALIELQLGITKICATDPIKAVKLSAWYQKLTSGIIKIVPTDKDVCEVLGALAAEPRLRHLMIADRPSKRKSGLQDLHIAAAALVHRAAIATFNIADFMLIDSYYPLPGVYNPLTQEWHARIRSIFEETESEDRRVASGYTSVRA